jgi:hypothetical protein
LGNFSCAWTEEAHSTAANATAREAGNFIGAFANFG